MRNRRTWILLACFPLLGAALAATAQGCNEDPYFIPCDNPIFNRKDHTGHADPCCLVDPCPGHCLDNPCSDAGEDAGAEATEAGASSSCAGDCAPVPPAGWFGPGLLRLGRDDGTVLACPDRAPVIGYQGHADPVLPIPALACGSCACSASSGTCGPPPTITASSAPCLGGSGTMSAFDGPAGWDGTCTAHDPIDGGAMVRSLTAAPLAVTGEGCTPSIVPPAQDPSQPTWATAVLECLGTTYPLGACVDHGRTCVPSAAPDFRMCIYQKDDQECPASYPDKHLVFAGFDDQRECTPCACGVPSGSSCTATLAVFKDGACGMTLLSAPVSSDSPSCFDLAPVGQALGSKTVTKLAYQSGPCAPSGGIPTGAAAPSGPSTFCCLPA